MRKLAIVTGFLVFAAIVGCGSGEESKQAAPASPAPTVAPAPAAPPAAPAAPGTPPSTAKAGPEPLAIFLDADTIEGKAPLTVNFDVDLDGGTAPYKWKWDFGDGKESTEANPKLVHVYDKPGTYMVEVTVDDAGSDSDFDILEIEVQ
jgi:PKD repeat protein